MEVVKSFRRAVKDFMNDQVPFQYEHITIRNAIQLLRKNKLKLLPIVNQKHTLIGIITVSSILKALSDKNASLDESISLYIIRDVITVYENDDLTEVRHYLNNKQVGQAVVLSENNQISGILDTSNILKVYQSRSDSLGNSLETLVQQMQTGIIALDHNGNILVMNHAAETMLSISENLAIGDHYSRVLPQFIMNNELHTFDIPLHPIEIKEKKLLITYKSLSSNSDYWGGIILLQDLTDYEEIATELEITKKLKQTLQTVLDTTYDGHIVIDHEGKIEMINNATCELIQKNNNTVINQPISEVLPEIKLDIDLHSNFRNEKLIAMVIRNKHCLVKKFPIYKENVLVGAIAKIIFKNLNQWKAVVSRLDHLEKEVSFYRGELSLIGGSPFDIDDIISNNDEMNKMKQLAKKSATGFSNVLLLGESGTGKELFARGIHAASNRLGNFIKVNCAAIPENLWESEFFGYADGAFSGAKRGGKPGKFELAHNGTIFLDEIGDMPLSMQVKLLRVLQERELERVGGTETIRVNVRIIAATNKDLEKMVTKNEFREDLYYRLNVIVINIPPLRERKEDIPILALSITKKLGHVMGIGTVTISHSALQLLKVHHWPGNVRELENVIERAMNCINSNIINEEHLPEYIQKQKNTSHLQWVSPIQTNSNNEESISMLYKKNMKKVEKESIIIALKQTGGNRTAAAKLLGISRSQFYKKLNKYNLE